MAIGCLVCNEVFNSHKSFNEHIIQFISELLLVSGVATPSTDQSHAIDMIIEALRAHWTEEGGLLNSAPENTARRAGLVEFAKHVGQQFGKGHGDPTPSALFVFNVTSSNRVMVSFDIHSNTTLAEAIAATVMHEQSVFHASVDNLVQVASERFSFVGNHGVSIDDVQWQKLKRSVES
ncbi:hypothetical protein Q9L58_001894 [Maublancomyces gigas]|uniref:Uncharacterized protein n=1 Tax=Discina gigas TaxID=1032678 RepID=A0ABR3GSW1_9PEZI